MKLERDLYSGPFNLSILGLGYESRSIYAIEQFENLPSNILVLGYEDNTKAHHYQSNKMKFEKLGACVLEGDDQSVLSNAIKYLDSHIGTKALNLHVDISVLTRARIGTIVKEVMSKLPQDSRITFSYSLSAYVPPPKESTPIKVVGELCEGLSGVMGNMNLPVSLVMGLGYEPDKALGVSTLLDVEENFVFIPRGLDRQFEWDVVNNNSDLLENLPPQNRVNYDVLDPYHTYITIKSLLLDLVTTSRPLLIPLGPKVLTVLSIILAKEFDFSIPVWRVSSEHTETPVERPASGELIEFTITL